MPDATVISAVVRYSAPTPESISRPDPRRAPAIEAAAA